MGFGWGSEIVATVLAAELAALPEAAGMTIIGLPVIPPGLPLPGLCFAPEFSSYDHPLGAFKRDAGSAITYEALRFVVTAQCEGFSTDPIEAVATAQRDALDGLVKDVVHDDIAYQATFVATGAVPLTTVLDGATFYRQLGTVYAVELVTGG